MYLNISVIRFLFARITLRAPLFILKVDNLKYASDDLKTDLQLIEQLSKNKDYKSIHDTVWQYVDVTKNHPLVKQFVGKYDIHDYIKNNPSFKRETEVHKYLLAGSKSFYYYFDIYDIPTEEFEKFKYLWNSKMSCVWNLPDYTFTERQFKNKKFSLYVIDFIDKEYGFNGIDTFIPYCKPYIQYLTPRIINIAMYRHIHHYYRNTVLEMLCDDKALNIPNFFKNIYSFYNSYNNVENDKMLDPYIFKNMSKLAKTHDDLKCILSLSYFDIKEIDTKELFKYKDLIGLVIKKGVDITEYAPENIKKEFEIIKQYGLFTYNNEGKN